MLLEDRAASEQPRLVSALSRASHTFKLNLVHVQTHSFADTHQLSMNLVLKKVDKDLLNNKRVSAFALSDWNRTCWFFCTRDLGFSFHYEVYP
jgi:hypothetical protein